MTQDQLREFSAEWAKWRDDPDRFNTVALRRPPYWSKQQEICRSIVRFRTTVVYSGNAVGKSFLLAGIIAWWLYSRPEALVICTAASQTSIGSIIFKELRRAIEGSHLPKPKISLGIKTSPAVIEIAPGWHGLGYSTTTIERASGQHARELLVVCDEASAIEPEIFDALESLKYTRLLAMGNPIRAEGVFVDLIRQADADRADGIPKNKATNAIRIPSTDSPDAEKEHSEYGLADKTWIDATRRRYGRDSLYCRSHIDALIPELSADVLIPPDWLDRATSVQRVTLPPNHPVHRTRRIAVDLGEGVGRDSTAILVRDADGILDLIAGSALSLAEGAAETARLARVWAVPADRISYDKLGIGRDFRNHLVKHGLGDAVGYAGSGRAQAPKQFTNLRTEAAWKARRRLDPERHLDDRYPLSSRQSPFHIPPRGWWQLLREDLEALTYDLTGNQTRLLRKEDWCDVLGRSPDRGDAFIQSFFQDPAG